MQRQRHTCWGKPGEGLVETNKKKEDKDWTLQKEPLLPLIPVNRLSLPPMHSRPATSAGMSDNSGFEFHGL